MDKIKVVGARLHNLKDLNVEIPKKKMVVNEITFLRNIIF